MIFVDEARISVKAGDGGKGCESFHRDKSMRFPHPDGGDGGRGGHIILKADRSVQTLLDFRYKQHYKGERGVHGGSRGKRGRNGKDCILRVPQGTLVKDYESGLLLKDLIEDGETLVTATGGKGGRGNEHSKFIHPPGVGEERVLKLELKVIADVGLIGFPNAGKSSIISAVSRVKSKVANYPFTTKSPILGFVEYEEASFIMADLPGIIEGAHKGRGLGDKFLKHAERTKVLVHVIDMSGCEGRDPLEDFKVIDYEIRSYNEHFAHKPRLIVANKMDTPEAKEHLSRFRQQCADEVLAVSAVTESGLDDLLQKVCGLLCKDNFQDL